VPGFGIASDRHDRRTARGVFSWPKNYLRRAALADFVCAIAGVFVAAQLRFGSDVTGTYIALSLALLVLWIAAHWLAEVRHSRRGDLATAVQAFGTATGAVPAWLSFAFRPADDLGARARSGVHHGYSPMKSRPVLQVRL
jgi:hypothetical protein